MWVVFSPYSQLGYGVSLLGQKSDNLQYNTLGRWVDGTNDSLTKRLMFQALFFFIISYRLKAGLSQEK